MDGLRTCCDLLVEVLDQLREPVHGGEQAVSADSNRPALVLHISSISVGNASGQGNGSRSQSWACTVGIVNSVERGFASFSESTLLAMGRLRNSASLSTRARYLSDHRYKRSTPPYSLDAPYYGTRDFPMPSMYNISRVSSLPLTRDLNHSMPDPRNQNLTEEFL